MNRKSSGDTPIKDFMAIRGPMQLKIVPQTPRGWRMLGIWLLLLMAPVIPFGWLAMVVDDTPQEHWALWALIPLCISMGLLIWAMTRWMLARAQIVQIEDLAGQEKGKQRRQNTRRPR